MRVSYGFLIGSLASVACGTSFTESPDAGSESGSDARTPDGGHADARSLRDGNAGSDAGVTISPNGLDIPPEFRSAYDDNRTATMELVTQIQATWNGSHPPLLQGVELNPGDAINSIHAANSASSYETGSVDPFLSATFGTSGVGATFAKMLIHFPMAEIPDGTGTTFWEWEATHDCTNFDVGSMTCAEYFYQDRDGVAGHWCGVPNGSGGYYATDSQCGRLVATWQYIISQIHTKYGGKVIVQSQVQPKSANGSNVTTVYNLSGFYETLTYPEFNAGRAAQCSFLGNWKGAAAPDYLNVLSEPDTMYEKGAPAQTDPASANFVENIQLQLSTILNSMNTASVPASVTRVIGMGNWEAKLSCSPDSGSAPCGILDVETGINSLITGYPSSPGVSILDLHMHYNNDCSIPGNPCGSDTRNYMAQAIVIAKAARAAGLGLGFDESWPFEYSNLQLGDRSTNLSLLEANDAHSFWQPFNELWMVMLDMMAYDYSASYISFSEPNMYFFNSDVDSMSQSLDCDPLPSSDAGTPLPTCSVGNITQYVTAGVASDLSTPPLRLTPTGAYLKRLIASPTTSVQMDESPPSAPTGLSGVVESNNVSLSWTASTDHVGVVDYAIYLDGELIGHSTDTTYGDYSAQRRGSYTVIAEDANGNQSAASAAYVGM